MAARVVHALTMAAAAAALLQQPSLEPFREDLSAAATRVNAAADYDRDGDIDLFVGFNGSANRFYLNNRGRL